MSRGPIHQVLKAVFPGPRLMRYAADFRYRLPVAAYPPYPPNGPSRAPLTLGAVVGLVGVIAATAAITYAVTRRIPPAPTPGVSTATSGVDQQAAAKKRVCDLFDAGTRNQAGKGGALAEGKLNTPLVLRMVNTAAAVESALTPDVPTDVARVAREYVASVFDLTTEALGDGNVERGNQFNAANIKTIDAFMDVCGIPR